MDPLWPHQTCQIGEARGSLALKVKVRLPPLKSILKV